MTDTSNTKEVTTLDHPLSSGLLDFDVVVVGAGATGLYTLYSMRRAGLKVRLVDDADDLGGNWYQNQYPGCRNDTMVGTYEFLQKDMWDSWDWNELYPARE